MRSNDFALVTAESLQFELKVFWIKKESSDISTNMIVFTYVVQYCLYVKEIPLALKYPGLMLYV